jgi:hypothetical protein
VTLKPGGALGVRPGGQPTTWEYFSADELGSGCGRVGFGPMPDISAEGCCATADPVKAKTTTKRMMEYTMILPPGVRPSRDAVDSAAPQPP